MTAPAVDPAYLPIMKRVRVDKARWNPLAELLAIGVKRPQTIPSFIVAAIQEVLPLSGFWTELMEWVPEQAWPELLKVAVPAMLRGRESNKPRVEFDVDDLDIESALMKIAEQDYEQIYDQYEQLVGNDKKNPVADEVVRFAAINFPRMLHPWLKELFDYNLATMNGIHLRPFRYATPTVNDFLWDILYDDEGSVTRQATAFFALLESRSFPTIEKAIALADRVDFNGYFQEQFAGWNLNLPDRSTEESVKLALQKIGYSTDGSDLRQLFNPTVWHIQLAHDSYQPPTHPTWDPKRALETVYGTGGVRLSTACDLCRGPMARLLTVPSELNESAENLNYPPHVEICPSCANFEHVYFQLNDQNQVKVCTTKPNEAMELQEYKPFESKPQKLRFSQLPERWFFQEWAGTGGNLYRLGGVPSWIQGPEYPACPCCEQTMSFFLQHDMGYPAPKDEKVGVHSDGMTHYFWCEPCRVYVSRFQMT
jgi:hypothetical protein